MPSDKISVIMSVYNEREAWLRTAIESILCQTHRDLEFIVLLDAPDNTVLENVILEYAARDSRIVFLKNDRNRGLVYSLNRGIEAATGDYIARMDADDISEPARLETELRALRERQLDIVGSPTLYISEDSDVPENRTFRCVGTSPEACRRILRVRNFISHPTWLARGEMFRSVVGPYHDIPRAEDYEWICRAAALGRRIEDLSEPLLLYRERTSSVSTSRPYAQRLVMQAVRREYRRAFREGRPMRLEPVLRDIERIDMQRDDDRFRRGRTGYLKAWAQLRQKPFAAVIGIIRGLILCPQNLAIGHEFRLLDRIERNYGAGR